MYLNLYIIKALIVIFKNRCLILVFMISQERSKRKPSGGRYRSFRKKKLRFKGSNPTFTIINDFKLRVDRVRGGNLKFRLLSVDKANVFNPKTKKTVVAEISSVIDNPANRQFTRQNIITKGCVIQTAIGKAKVTSRPGQHGVVNAVLIE